jgi:hypothetical protein
MSDVYEALSDLLDRKGEIVGAAVEQAKRTLEENPGEDVTVTVARYDEPYGIGSTDFAIW